MSEKFSPDFLFSTIKNVNFGSQWVVVNMQVGGTANTAWRAEMDFPGSAAGTPGILCFTQANANANFRPLVNDQSGLPSYTVGKTDLINKLRTDAGLKIPAFGASDPSIPFFAVLFVQLNDITKRMRLNYTSDVDTAFVNVTTYKDLKVGTTLTSIDPNTQGFSIGTDTKKEDRQFYINPATSGRIDISIDVKKLTISLS